MSDVGSTDSPPAAPRVKAKALEVVLARRAWRAPLLIASASVALLATVNLGSVRACGERGRVAGRLATRGLGAHRSAAWS